MYCSIIISILYQYCINMFSSNYCISNTKKRPIGQISYDNKCNADTPHYKHMPNCEICTKKFKSLFSANCNNICKNPMAHQRHMKNCAECNNKFSDWITVDETTYSDEDSDNESDNESDNNDESECESESESDNDSECENNLIAKHYKQNNSITEHYKQNNSITEHNKRVKIYDEHNNNFDDWIFIDKPLQSYENENNNFNHMGSNFGSKISETPIDNSETPIDNSETPIIQPIINEHHDNLYSQIMQYSSTIFTLDDHEILQNDTITEIDEEHMFVHTSQFKINNFIKINFIDNKMNDIKKNIIKIKNSNLSDERKDSIITIENNNIRKLQQNYNETYNKFIKIKNNIEYMLSNLSNKYKQVNNKYKQVNFNL